MHPNKKNVNPIEAKHSYSALIAPMVLQEVLGASKFKKVKRKVIQDFIGDSKVDNMDVQMVMDGCGISRTGYSNMFKAVTSKLKDKKITTSFLPLLAHMRKSRAKLNDQVADFLGPSFHIQGIFESKDRKLHFSEFNNIFFDLQNLQKRMVKFYNISMAEVNNKLVFVLKLDECEILKQKKTERITVTLMSRALQSKPTNGNDGHSFSVQSENNIWWLGSFEVCISPPPRLLTYVNFNLIFHVFLYR